MVNQQLLDYIKQQLKQGVSREQIRSSLMANGWQEADINEAFVSINSPISSTSPENIAAQQFSTISQQPERRINKTLLAIFSILGILIIGGGVFGSFYYFKETPEKVIETMRTRFAEVKALEYHGEIKAEVAIPDLLGGGSFMQPAQQTTSSKKASDFSINLNGKSDVGDLNNPKGLFVFNIKTDALKELTQRESAFGLEVRAINKVVYVKFNNLPNLGFFDLSVLSNQWIKIDTEAIKKQLDLEKFEGQKEAQKQQELTPEQAEKLRQIIAQANVFKVTEKLASEKIEGMDTHHYKFLIDKNELKKLIVDISGVVQNKTLTDKELTEFDKGLEAIGSLGGEIWIGKKDYLPYKLLFTIGIKETAEPKITGQLTTTLSFKNYNKPIQIDIPSPVKSIEEISDQLFSSTKEKARDARRQADISQIQIRLEIYYVENNSYPFSLNELSSQKDLPSMPVDPLTNQPYQYQLQLNGTDYQVCAKLESTKTQKCVTSQF